MKRTRFTEEQIIAVLREQEGGATTADVCRKHGISSATFYAWKAKYGGLEVSDAKRLRGLEYATPAAYAASLTATGDRLRTPDPLRRSPVAPPAHSRHHDRRTLASAG